MPTLLLVGAGHAQLALLARLDSLKAQGISVTVIDRAPELWYSGMVPAVLGGRVDPSGAVIPIKKIVEQHGGRFVEGTVSAIVPRTVSAKLSDGRSFFADVMSIGVGSEVRPRFGIDEESRTRVVAVKPVSGIAQLRNLGTDATDQRRGVHAVAVIGGGPSAVEVAGNLARNPSLAVTVLARGDRLLSRMPEEAARIAEHRLRRRGLIVRTKFEVTELANGQAVGANGERVAANLFVIATGLGVPSFLAASGLPCSGDGAVRVDASMRVAGRPIFVGGDCAAVADFELGRNGVHAVRQAPIIADNVEATLKETLQGPDIRSHETELFPGGSLRVYTPPRDPLLIINLGDGTGIMVRGSRVRHGRLWLMLKERIDWSFVRSAGQRIFPALSAPPRP